MQSKLHITCACHVTECNIRGLSSIGIQPIKSIPSRVPTWINVLARSTRHVPLWTCRNCEILTKWYWNMARYSFFVYSYVIRPLLLRLKLQQKVSSSILWNKRDITCVHYPKLLYFTHVPILATGFVRIRFAFFHWLVCFYACVCFCAILASIKKRKEGKKNGQHFTPYVLFSDIITLLASVMAFKIHRRWSLFHVRRVWCPGNIIKMAMLAVTIIIQTSALWFVCFAFLVTLLKFLHWET